MFGTSTFVQVAQALGASSGNNALMRQSLDHIAKNGLSAEMQQLLDLPATATTTEIAERFAVLAEEHIAAEGWNDDPDWYAEDIRDTRDQVRWMQEVA